jgi:hypothetical protein
MAAKKKKRRATKRKSKTPKSNIGLPFGKWLKGPFRLRKNARGVLIDLKR